MNPVSDLSNTSPLKLGHSPTTISDPAGTESRHRRPLIILLGAPLLGASWILMWTQDTFWNPVFFLGMWTGATFLMYAGGRDGYPGWRRHLLLAAVSVPLWWWFELVNSRVGNWEYIDRHNYSSAEYFLLASLAFSTVVPALHSAWGVTIGKLRPPATRIEPDRRHGYVIEMLAGIGTVMSVFALPDFFFPMVWFAPFLLFDGLVGYRGGRSLANEVFKGEWHLATAIGLAGLICGFLWEFWNFWSTPKWIYHIQYLDFLRAFEMPLLGYIGYIPFAWSVYQLLHLRPVQRYLVH